MVGCVLGGVVLLFCWLVVRCSLGEGSLYSVALDPRFLKMFITFWLFSHLFFHLILSNGQVKGRGRKVRMAAVREGCGSSSQWIGGLGRGGAGARDAFCLLWLLIMCFHIMICQYVHILSLYFYCYCYIFELISILVSIFFIFYIYLYTTYIFMYSTSASILYTLHLNVSTY